MLLSKYYLPILKENPAEATIASHRLMLRAGMIRQLSSGIYSFLPLGLKVLQKIEAIIQREMNQAGALEVLMPCIQPAELWKESGRYDDYGKEMLRIKDRHEHDLLFGPTNEEVITDIFRQTVKSYRDLPKNLYHIQWKFRDEIRPRFGVMRGREFLMKDAYSFDLTLEGAKQSYDTMVKTYLRIFAALGLRAVPVAADSGAIGGNLSHEFHILADTGESQLYYDAHYDEINVASEPIETLYNLYAVSEEKYDVTQCPVPAERLKQRRGIEVGHVFYFGTKYSKAMNAMVTNQEGKLVPVEMGSYGIGVTRLIGALIEANHDDRGIKWPTPVAPFMVSLLNLKQGHEECDKVCDQIYQTLVTNKVEVLYDDTQESPGSKFATHDLIGSPWQVCVGPRGLSNNSIELKNRYTGEKQDLSIEAVISQLTKVNR